MQHEGRGPLRFFPERTRHGQRGGQGIQKPGVFRRRADRHAEEPCVEMLLLGEGADGDALMEQTLGQFGSRHGSLIEPQEEEVRGARIDVKPELGQFVAQPRSLAVDQLDALPGVLFIGQQHGRGLLRQNVHRPGKDLAPDLLGHRRRGHGKAQAQAGDRVELRERTHDDHVRGRPPGQRLIAGHEIGKGLVDHEGGRGMPGGKGQQQGVVQRPARGIVGLPQEHQLAATKLRFQGRPIEGKAVAFLERPEAHFAARWDGSCWDGSCWDGSCTAIPVLALRGSSTTAAPTGAGRPDRRGIVGVRRDGNHRASEGQGPSQGVENFRRAVTDDDFIGRDLVSVS